MDATVARFGAGGIAGVDEAGRGPLAGEVVAAAVILPADHGLAGLDDSKKLSEKRRNSLFDEIRQCAIAYSVAEATVQEIDTLNILQASLLAMKRAVQGLDRPPAIVLVDGNRTPAWEYHSEAIVGGDAFIDAISAASILAKVTRDRSMIELSRRHPEYGFDQHKGYGTAKHLTALEQFGPLEVHRTTFSPIRKIIEALD